jgi:type III restriction enzyme
MASFFEHPILNSPYERPGKHWELSETGQPTNVILPERRRCALISPIPKSKTAKGGKQSSFLAEQDELGLDQEYNPIEIINGIRQAVDSWRELAESQWQVTPATARLLKHWRSHPFQNQRPFFCQVEAVETIIWLTEVAPKSSAQGRRFWTHVEEANRASNPDLLRLALKLATGAGKTTVMAMLIAWQTVNAVRHPAARKYTSKFLVIAPGITIRDRLQILQPNHPESYYRSREIVPEEMLPDLGKARIVITNFHAFKKRMEIPLNKVQQAALRAEPREETDGAMLRRVCGELLGEGHINVLNDEAHHCYRERPLSEEERKALKGDDLEEAKENNEAARLWISGIEALKRQGKLGPVFDLSATPFFLKGSGYREGTLFGWTVSDFSLMDAIEAGIVKLPRVPIVDNVPGADIPKFRDLWEEIKKGPVQLPKKGRANAKDLNPQKLPPILLSAIDALYGHYEETVAEWREAAIGVDPVFIVVCNNTATSKLIHDYISGYIRHNDDSSSQLVQGRCKLFQNFSAGGDSLPVMRTLLIDSSQLESGEAISPDFREAAAGEIERFRQELVQRTGDQRAGEKLTDEDLLREVMNTVGRPGRLGEGIRCVVSVSMLTEGWDANTVTHILGVRAFGTQLLCEQVVGRALRRQSYRAGVDGLFSPEYADIFGIPFAFTANPVKAKPKRPDNMVNVRALCPERDQLEIIFPRVEGYRTELPQSVLKANFNDSHTIVLTPDLVGPSRTVNTGIIGRPAEMTMDHLKDERRSTIIFELTNRILARHFTDPGEPMKLSLFGPLKSIVRHWVDNHLIVKDGCAEAQLLYQEVSERAAERIMSGITLGTAGGGAVRAVLDAYNRQGSTRHVNFNTSQLRYETDPDKSHINWCVLDSTWEGQFCTVVESHPRVLAYARNHNLGFEVPYRAGSTVKRYRPDFIVRIDDGRGPEDPLNLVVEVKGYRGEDAKDKALTMQTYWVPAVNNLRTFGRWDFVEFTDAWAMHEEFGRLVEQWLSRTITERAA